MQNQELPAHKKLAESHALKADFKYRHKNPYHDKLGEYGHFVLRDEEAEIHGGKWVENVFKHKGPLHVEIGSGYGHFIREFCADHLEVNFVGIDYRFKRAFNLVRKINNLGLKNVRFLRAKGERVEFMFNEEEVDTLYLFFPDPWRKAKHNKKRIFQKPFLDACHKVLKTGGRLCVKTDHDEYALWMLCHILDDDRYNLVLDTADLAADFPDHPLNRYKTKFEKIFMDQNIKTKAFILEKK